MKREYEQAWRDLRRRRRVNGWLSLGLFGAAIIHAGFRRVSESPLFYGWMLVFVAGTVWEFMFKCPRCGGRFLGRLSWRGPMRCKHCDLPEGADDVQSL